MKAVDLLSMAKTNIMRGRLRTILTGLAISIGIASVVLLTVIGQTGKSLINKSLAGLGLEGIMVFSGNKDGLSLEDAQRIQARIPSVTKIMPLETGFGTVNSQDSRRSNAILMGVDEQVGHFIKAKPIFGRLFTQNESERGELVCLVDSGLAQNRFKRQNIVGKTLQITSSAGITQEYTIIGVIPSQLGSLGSLSGSAIPPFIYIPYRSMGVVPERNVRQLIISTDSAYSEKTASNIEELLRRTNSNGKHFQVENISGYREDFDQILDIVTQVLSTTAAISLLVAGLGIMNTMLAAVNERRSEIGICKAIGAGRAQIAFLFLTEAFLITLSASLLGVLLGLAIAFAGSLWLKIPIVVPFTKLLMPTMVTSVIGLLSGLAPAMKAARLQPVSAIRDIN
jgi:putative ABC transport system permease protein